MTWRSGLLVVANVALLAWIIRGAVTHAQQAPETDLSGVPFLKVNINPTPVAPVVNINPAGRPAQVEVAGSVEVSRLPEVRTAPRGCENPNNFETAVGRSISGPIQVTFLNVPQQTAINLADTNGRSYRVPFNPANQVGTTIQLKSGQRLDFDTDVMYSGCRIAD